ncbi:MAG: 2-oxo acid dehydrogenase subunit E2 [Ideonella sp.]|nr:2-oxo acid dehydrogenase subunit E2 [Ideonella sp.]
MSIDILMPAGTSEATLTRWAKRPGDALEKGDVLLEIETDKAIVEVEAPGAGVLARIDVPEGSRGIEAGARLGLIAAPGEDAAALAVAAPNGAAAQTAPAAPATAAQAPAAPPATAASAAMPSTRVKASPLARRLAQAAGLALSALHGSGPGGRIVKVDVERALQQPPLVAPAAPTAPIAPTAVAHTTMRRVIAQRLSEAKRNVPHFYLSVEVDVDAVLALREQLQAQAGIKPSVNDFVVKAVALAMKRLPAVNASWGDEAMLRHERVDVSVAVATPGGLVTPIVRDADTKSLAAIQAEVKALAARARDGRLKAEEYQGGGFTISNLGMYGVREFFAIVNPPQAAILAVGACEQRPVVRHGALAVGMRMTCSLSADHRVIDGALGAEFLAAVRGLIEAPLALLV